jgi:hypothetical protein
LIEINVLSWDVPDAGESVHYATKFQPEQIGRDVFDTRNKEPG